MHDINKVDVYASLDIYLINHIITISLPPVDMGMIYLLKVGFKAEMLGILFGLLYEEGECKRLEILHVRH